MSPSLVPNPLIWPKVPSGPGRVLEFTVRGADDVQNVKDTNQHARRQRITGTATAQNTNCVFSLTDWPRGSESQLTSPTHHTAGKATVTHVVDMPGGPETTPLAGWYMVTGMRAKQKDQEAVAASIDAYLRGIFHCGTFNPVFHHIGVSKTDPEMLLSVQGWPSREEAEEYWDSGIHRAFSPAVRDLIDMDLGPFNGALDEK